MQGGSGSRLASSDRDTRSAQSKWEQQALLETTATLYIGEHSRAQRSASVFPVLTKLEPTGNLSFFTTEEQMYELFGRVTDPAKGGGVRRIIMGLDRNNKTPCGFAFVE